MPRPLGGVGFAAVSASISVSTSASASAYASASDVLKIDSSLAISLEKCALRFHRGASRAIVGSLRPQTAHAFACIWSARSATARPANLLGTTHLGTHGSSALAHHGEVGVERRAVRPVGRGWRGRCGRSHRRVPCCVCEPDLQQPQQRPQRKV